MRNYEKEQENIGNTAQVSEVYRCSSGTCASAVQRGGNHKCKEQTDAFNY